MMRIDDVDRKGQDGGAGQRLDQAVAAVGRRHRRDGEGPAIVEDQLRGELLDAVGRERIAPAGDIGIDLALHGAGSAEIAVDRVHARVALASPPHRAAADRRRRSRCPKAAGRRRPARPKRANGARTSSATMMRAPS